MGGERWEGKDGEERERESEGEREREERKLVKRNF
jgi:hypothetical protein